MSNIKEYVIKWLNTNTGLNTQSIYNFANTIQDMETKQINIIPPQNMEIIREIKDGIETISFKPIEEKKITYKDVCDKLFIGNTTCYLIGDRILNIVTTEKDTFRFKGNESLTEQEQEATLCEGMLRNVARYLNPEGWLYVPVINEGWHFYINKDTELLMNCNTLHIYPNIYFQSKQLMKQAEEILGEEVIRKALIKQY